MKTKFCFPFWCFICQAFVTAESIDFFTLKLVIFTEIMFNLVNVNGARLKYTHFEMNGKLTVKTNCRLRISHIQIKYVIVNCVFFSSSK